MNDTIELNGRTYTVRIEPDNTTGAPWEEFDGHGIVSELTTRSKRAGELVLNTDHQHKRYYDVAATIRKARAESWGLNAEASATFARQFGGWRAPTAREVTAEAVRQDFEHLRAWCNDEWYWCGIIVTDDETGAAASVWGIQSDDDACLEMTASELAAELNNTAKEC